MRLIHRWLAGETVNNTVGIKIVGGPFHGRTKIVTLASDGTPPQRFRARGGRRSLPTPQDGPADWHAYEAAASEDSPAGWIYTYAGPGSDEQQLSSTAQLLDQTHRGTPRSHRDTPAQFVADQTALLDQSRSQQGHHRPQLSQRPVGFPTVVQVLKEQPDLLHHQVGALQQCPAGRRRLPTAVSGTLAPTGLLTRRLRVVTLVGISAGSRGEQHPSRVDCARPSRAVGLRLARPVAVAPRPLPPARWHRLPAVFALPGRRPGPHPAQQIIHAERITARAVKITCATKHATAGRHGARCAYQRTQPRNTVPGGELRTCPWPRSSRWRRCA